MAHHTIHKRIWLSFLLVLIASPSLWAQQSDMDLLRQHLIEAPHEGHSVEYGIEPGRQTLSPLYHAASGSLWLWENLVAPEVCSPGGYTDTNTAYFKGLVMEYGAVRAFFYGWDRMVRNTKIGRHTTPTNQRGLIDDSIDRYRQ